MMTRKKKVITFIITAIAVLTLGVVAYFLWVVGMVYWLVHSSAEKAHKQKDILIYQTDHTALREACRKVSEESFTGKWEFKSYNMDETSNPAISKFPQIILHLKPSYVTISENGTILIELLGGLGHVGVIAYPKDFKPPYKDFKYGDKELVPGLWYYED
jgi:hypothetical protein